MQPMHAIKNDKDSDISLIKQVTSWLRSGHVTRDTINQVKEFLRHEEYGKCLKCEKTCSKAKLLVLFALDIALAVAYSKWDKDKLIFEPFVSKLRQWQIRKAEEKAPIFGKKQEKRFVSIKRDRKTLRNRFAFPFRPQNKPEVMELDIIMGDTKSFFENIFKGSELYLKNIKNLLIDSVLSNAEKVLTTFKNARTDDPEGYSAIGVAAASYRLDESKKKEVINFLMDEIGIIPTEKDKQMVRLAEWDEDQPTVRDPFQEFIGTTRGLQRRGEIHKEALSPEIYKEIWKKVVPEPLLPEAPKEKELFPAPGREEMEEN